VSQTRPKDDTVSTSSTASQEELLAELQRARAELTALRDGAEQSQLRWQSRVAQASSRAYELDRQIDELREQVRTLGQLLVQSERESAVRAVELERLQQAHQRTGQPGDGERRQRPQRSLAERAVRPEEGEPPVMVGAELEQRRQSLVEQAVRLEERERAVTQRAAELEQRQQSRAGQAALLEARERAMTEQAAVLEQLLQTLAEERTELEDWDRELCTRDDDLGRREEVLAGQVAAVQQHGWVVAKLEEELARLRSR